MEKNNQVISFNNITVYTLTGGAGIFVGSNVQLNWSSRSHENIGLGKVTGDYNLIHQNVNIVSDDDIVDTL